MKIKLRCNYIYWRTYHTRELSHGLYYLNWMTLYILFKKKWQWYR